jgi:hypothetical protein
MSKQILKQTIAAATIFSFLTLQIFQPTQLKAQSKTKATTKQSVARASSVVKMTDTMLKETSVIRSLPILRPVKSGTQTRTQIEQMLLNNLNKEINTDEIRAVELTLKKLGLVTSNFDYRSLVVKLLTEQVAGFYEPKSKKFYLADWISIDAQKPIMVHELTHALQDQHFDLERFDNWSKTESDSRLAITALVEGDATAAMYKYILENPLVAIKAFASMGNINSEQLNNAPRVIRESFGFPYQQGTEFVGRLYNKGGWDMVSSAYTTLPQSTEQILHIEKYLKGEQPIKISLPDLSSDLGQDWKLIENNVNGEWGYYLTIVDFMSGNEEAAAAVAGWGGDRFNVYATKKNEVVFVAQTAWDSDKDASEFYNAYAKRTDKRYGELTRVSDASPKALEATYWRTKEGQVVLMRNASKVLILEGIPDNVSTQNLIAKIWRG